MTLIAGGGAIAEPLQTAVPLPEPPAPTILGRAAAVAEVLVVMFVVLRLAGQAVSATSLWQTAGPLERNILAHAVMMAVPVLLIALLRRAPRDFGLTTNNLRGDLQVAMTAFLPVALASALLGFLDYTALPSAILLAAANVAALLWVARALAKGTDVGSGLLTIALFVLMAAALAVTRGAFPDPARAALTFVCYALFVGPGEEILYRGYVQSRLNQAFGRPWTFYGVRAGWGLVLTCLLFGLTHVLNVDAATGQTGWYWGWGLWTVFGGLVLGYVRERTGNVLAPAILHGLPQALAASLLVP